MLDEAERRVQDDQEVRHYGWEITYQLALASAASPIAEFRDPRRAIRAAEQGVEEVPARRGSLEDPRPGPLPRGRLGRGDPGGREGLRGPRLPGYAYIHTILAAAYARKGETEKAKEWFAKLPPKFEPEKMNDTPRDLLRGGPNAPGRHQALDRQSKRRAPTSGRTRSEPSRPDDRQRVTAAETWSLRRRAVVLRHEMVPSPIP